MSNDNGRFDKACQRLEALAKAGGGAVALGLSQVFKAGPLSIEYYTPTPLTIAALDPELVNMVEQGERFETDVQKMSAEEKQENATRGARLVVGHITDINGIALPDGKTWKTITQGERLHVFGQIGIIAPEVYEAFVDEVMALARVSQAEVEGSPGQSAAM